MRPVLPAALLMVLAPALADGQEVPPGLPRLTGVVIGPAHRAAIFDAAAGQPSALQEGEHIASYVVRLIRPNAVQVESGGRSYTIVPSPLGGATRAAPADTGGGTFGLAVNPPAPPPN